MGGRGTSSFASGGGRQTSGSDKFSSGLGPTVGATLKEALGKKGNPIPIKEAYKDANPLFEATKREGYAEYTKNCQRCIVAYELRRRGYDVVALPTYSNDNLPNVKSYRDKQGNIQYRDVWTQAFQHAKVENVGSSRNSAVVTNITNLMKSYGNGARAVVGVNWQGGGGHVFSIENRGGKIIAIDAQIGKQASLAQALSGSIPKDTQVTRLDNLRVSDKARFSVTSKR